MYHYLITNTNKVHFVFTAQVQLLVSYFILAALTYIYTNVLYPFSFQVFNFQQDFLEKKSGTVFHSVTNFSF